MEVVVITGWNAIVPGCRWLDRALLGWDIHTLRRGVLFGHRSFSCRQVGVEQIWRHVLCVDGLLLYPVGEEPLW